MKGRVIEVQRIHVMVMLDDGTVVNATVRGEFHASGDYPKVGDWVLVSLVQESEESQAVIESVLPRKSVLTRLNQETRQEQVLVANVDVVFIVMGLDGDFNTNRLERYLLLARQADVQSVIVLNKSDIATNLSTQVAEVAAVADECPVHIISALTGDGIVELRSYLVKDETAVLLGSSGAGKSTITNWLLGDELQDVQSVRSGDGRGRHTTTTRQLFVVPTGGYLIDTPGMRELSVVADQSVADDALIAQINELALQCVFRNCDHDQSAGCAVLEAVRSGAIPERSLENYYKLVRERDWQQRGSSKKMQYAEQSKKRNAQARAVAHRKRLLGGG